MISPRQSLILRSSFEPGFVWASLGKAIGITLPKGERGRVPSRVPAGGGVAPALPLAQRMKEPLSEGAAFTEQG